MAYLNGKKISLSGFYTVGVEGTGGEAFCGWEDDIVEIPNEISE